MEQKRRKRKLSKLIAIGLSPNIDGSDVKLAFKSLLNPKSWHDKNEVEALRSEFASFLDIAVPQVYPTISGRAALIHALNLIGVSKGDEVIMQVFNCVAVLDPILWVGAKPVFVDIKRNTLNTTLEQIKKKTTDKTKAIIIQHTFGLPNDELDAIIAFAHSKGIYVIEDCAHALGAEIDDEPVGTIADFGIFSFGRDKMISSVFGGALVLSKLLPQKLFDEMDRIYSSLEEVDDSWIKRQLLHPVLTYLTLLPAPLKHLGKLIHLLGNRYGLMSKATSLEEKACGAKPSWLDKAYPGALAKLARKQLSEFHVANARRTTIAGEYISAGIKNAQVDPRNAHHTIKRVFLRFPVLVDNPEQVHQKFKENDIILGDWYDQVIAPKEVDLKNTGYEKGQCPVAEDVCPHIINLPTYPRMTDDEVERVIRTFKSLRGEELES